MNEPLPSSSRSARPGPVGGMRAPSSASAGRVGIPEEQEERHRVGDADDAADVEGPAPAEARMIGHVAAEPADDHTHVDPHLVETDRPRARLAPVEIRDQCQRRGNVERLADPHERTGREQLLVRAHMSRRPRDQRPHEQAAGDDVPSRVAIGEIPSNGTEQGVDPLEERQDRAPVRLEPDVGNVPHH